MGIERSRRPVSVARMGVAARRLLNASTLCAIATVGAKGEAHVNTAYFAWSPSFDVVWLSDPDATHSRNLNRNRGAAVAVYDSGQTWGQPDRGIQLFGRAEEASPEVAGLYEARFPAYGDDSLGGYRFYVLHARRLKLFDEQEFGAGVFVTARVGRSGLVWEKTEISRPTNIRS